MAGDCDFPLQGLQARASALKRQTPIGINTNEIVPPKQIRTLRAALGDQSELITHADQQVLALEHHLSLVQESQQAF